MIFNRFKKIISVITAVVILMSMISCTNSDGEADNEDPAESQSTVIATPSVGIGRYNGESQPIQAGDNGIVICVDPGHGFIDGGCGEGYLADGFLEKDVNLAIANKLRDELLLLGFDVIMTHDGVSFPTSAVDDGNDKFNPYERVSYVNTLDVDYFISIHVNSYESDRSVSGLRIYFKETALKTAPISDEVAQSLALSVYNEFPDSKEPVVVDHTNDVSFAVIRETTAPASLVEVGFATNETDAANMIKDEWQKRIAKALAAGIDNYFSENEDGE